MTDGTSASCIGLHHSNIMNFKTLARCLSAFLLAAGPAALAADSPPDLTKDHVVYLIGYSHLDTQWRWTYPQVISEFIPNTVRANIPLFEKYPNYTFNWTGANRYRMLKEYDPADYAILKEWIARGRWFTAGSSWEENDVNVPSSESLIRQILLGHDYFKKEFGTESCEYMLPDCFGFPASLPSVLAHCGLRGFSTQKLTWHSANGIPFDIGVWEGPDGQSIIAALNPGSYSARVRGDVTTSSGLLDRVNRHGSMDGVFTDYLFSAPATPAARPTRNPWHGLKKAPRTPTALCGSSPPAPTRCSAPSPTPRKPNCPDTKATSCSLSIPPAPSPRRPT